MLEKAIVTAVMKILRARGWWCMKIHGSAWQRAGVPDVLAIKNGRALFVEVKQPGQSLTRLQVHVATELTAAGATVMVVTDSRAFNSVLAEYQQEIEVLTESQQEIELVSPTKSDTRETCEKQ